MYRRLGIKSRLSRPVSGRVPDPTFKTRGLGAAGMGVDTEDSHVAGSVPLTAEACCLTVRRGLSIVYPAGKLSRRVTARGSPAFSGYGKAAVMFHGPSGLNCSGILTRASAM